MTAMLPLPGHPVHRSLPRAAGLFQVPP